MGRGSYFNIKHQWLVLHKYVSVGTACWVLYCNSLTPIAFTLLPTYTHISLFSGVAHARRAQAWAAAALRRLIFQRRHTLRLWFACAYAC